MTAFFGVHLVLTIVSLALGTIIGALGVRALRAATGERASACQPSSDHALDGVVHVDRVDRRPRALPGPDPRQLIDEPLPHVSDGLILP